MTPLRVTSMNVIVALTTVFGLACIRPGAASQGVSPDEDRLLSAVLYFISDEPGTLDEVFNVHWKHLTRVCGTDRVSGDRCFARNLLQRSDRVALLYSGPSLASVPVAHVLASPRLRPGEEEDFTLALDVQPLGQLGAPQRWIEDVGDFSYGIHIDGTVREVGEWVLLVYPPVVSGMWLPLASPTLRVSTSSIEGTVLELESMVGVEKDGASGVRPAGDYIITSVRSNEVEFRAEVESDTQCEPREPPAVLPALIRVPASQFFEVDGRPRFRTKYTKGC
jgi:hypothetical protein